MRRLSASLPLARHSRPHAKKHPSRVNSTARPRFAISRRRWHSGRGSRIPRRTRRCGLARQHPSHAFGHACRSAVGSRDEPRAIRSTSPISSPGSIPAATKRILFLAHWDSRPTADSPKSSDKTKPVPGANDGGSGVALLLGVADALKRSSTTLGVDLLFDDGEDYGDFEARRRWTC